MSLQSDLTAAQAHLDGWLAADLALANAKETTHRDRRLTRADAQEVRDQINFWQRKVGALQARINGQQRQGSYAVFTSPARSR